MKKTLVAVAIALLGLLGLTTTASASAPVACSSLPSTPTSVTAAMAQTAATCTPDSTSGTAAATLRQCPAINQVWPTGDNTPWLSAQTWYLFPGTPDTCGSRAAIENLHNYVCPPQGLLENARVQWIDSAGTYHYAPTNGLEVPCYSANTTDYGQYVLSAGFPSYAFYLRLQLDTTFGSAADCINYPCVAWLRK